MAPLQRVTSSMHSFLDLGSPCQSPVAKGAENALVRSQRENTPPPAKADERSSYALAQSEAPKLFPHQLLRSRLEACATTVSVGLSLLADQREKLDGDGQSGLSSNKSASNAVDPLDLSIGEPTATSLQQVKLLVQSKTANEFDTSYESNSKSSKSAHLPAPVHLIKAITSSSQHNTQALSKSSWSVSDLGGDDDRDKTQFALASDPKQLQLEVTRNLPTMEIVLDDDRLHLFEGQLGSWLWDWLRETTEPPYVTVLEEEDGTLDTNRHDFNTETGILLPVIDYPDTYIKQDPEQEQDQEAKQLTWRQMNLTSELHINKELKARAKLADRLRAEIGYKAEAKRTAIEEVPWPSAACLIRPVTSSDLADITGIMNLERQRGTPPQLFHSDPIEPEDVLKIYAECLQRYRPFVVAVPSRDEFLDRSKWPQGADKEYEEYAEFKKAKMVKESPALLGFAYVTDTKLDVCGNPCPSSRFAGQIQLVVHPDHRQNSYGTALLDRILLCVAMYHRSVIDHKWLCPEPANVYEQQIARNQRKYSRIYIDTAFDGKDDPNIKWVTRMLEKFGFTRAGYYREALRMGSGFNSKWLDMAVWELEARPSREVRD